MREWGDDELRDSYDDGGVWALSLWRTRDAIRGGQLLSREVLEAISTRIQRLNPELNAYVALDLEAAAVAAHEADEVIASGNRPGRLCGVPVGVKDVFLSKDMPTTMGSAVYEGETAKVDAAVIERLKACGAVILGLHTAHELAYGPTGDVSFPRAAVNPRFPDRIPGGSSSGSAVAVAACLAYGAVGSDTGGSVRIPSAIQGLVGLKPTPGVISRFGMLPLAPSLDQAGTITRSVDDNALLLEAISGADSRDPCTWRGIGLDASQVPRDLHGIRLGVLVDYFQAETHREVSAALQRAVGTLIEAGATAREVTLPGAANAAAAHRVIVGAEAHWVNREHLSDTRLGDEVRRRLLRGATVGIADYLDARRDALAFDTQVRKAFREVDVMLCPTIPILPPVLGERETELGGVTRPTYERLTRFTAPFNVTASPALTLPCGHSGEGFPIGVQLVGAPLSENVLYRVGRVLEGSR